MPKPGNDTPCDARVADGIIRGTLVGGLWACFFGPGDTGRIMEATHLQVFGAASRHLLLSVAGFGCFFGAYNAVLCGAEKICGNDGRANLAGPIVAGGTMGAAIGAYLPPPRAVNIAAYSIFLASVSAGSAALINRNRPR